MINRAGSKCMIYIYTGGYTFPLLEVVAQPGSTQHFPMLNGWGLVAGTSLYAYIQSSGGNGIACGGADPTYDRHVTVRGYYFTVP